MSDKSSTDAAAINGELHGELYSPDYAVRINTEGKLGKEDKTEGHIGKGQQGELYSPGMQTSVYSQQNKQDPDKVKAAGGQDREKAKGVERTELSQPSSKL